MRILLTGTSGKVGGYLKQYWQEQHEVLALTRSVVALSDDVKLTDFLKKTSFDILLNPAAVSTPEACEANSDLAERVNISAPKVMAQICAARQKPFIHFSTDYVLDGNIPGFKDEASLTRPNNIYGQTKLAGEQAVLAAYPEATLARISWVFGSTGEGFLEKIFRLIQEQQPLEGVADKYSLPTSAPEIAKALDLIIEARANGLFHLTQTAEEPVSWHTYAEEVASAVYEEGLTPDLIPVSPRKMVDIPVLRTNRPIHTAMTPARLKNDLDHHMRPWKLVLRERVHELATSMPRSV